MLLSIAADLLLELVQIQCTCEQYPSRAAHFMGPGAIPLGKRGEKLEF